MNQRTETRKGLGRNGTRTLRGKLVAAWSTLPVEIKKQIAKLAGWTTESPRQRTGDVAE